MNQLKQWVLIAITLVVVFLVGGSLIGSLTEPQITDRLQLYQTDLLLHATEIDTSQPDQKGLENARSAVLGKDPLKEALNQYQEVRRSAGNTLKQLQGQSQPNNPIEAKRLQTGLQKQQELIDQLDLRIGILQAEQNQVPAAQDTWKAILDRAQQTGILLPSAETARVVSGLWSVPPRLLPNAETQIQKSLEGWFRYRSLTRLYELQQRSDALAALKASEQAIAQQTLVKLAVVGFVPLMGGVLGSILLIGLVVQRLTRGKQSVLGESGSFTWDVPWNWQTIWQVLIVGFFFAGQIAVPFLLESLGFSLSSFGSRGRAAYALTYYVLMAGAGLTVLYLSIRRYFPLPEDWFRFGGRRNWFVWGLGGYLVALPLMFAVSLVNQQIWQGQGGSNPLLQIVLEEGDPVALAMFFFTAAVAAPFFEEILFRGFLLPSLTRYLPVGGAIGVSALVFALAHLSLSEVLPLAVLGSVLGFVYTRSRGLLASMLLHSLWNSVTMVGLFVIGSGAGR